MNPIYEKIRKMLSVCQGKDRFCTGGCHYFRAPASDSLPMNLKK